MNDELWLVEDGQQGKDIFMAPKLALHLASSYPSRFRLKYVKPGIPSDQNPTNKESIMGHTLPEPFTAFKDGTHVCTVVGNQVTQGKFGEQEELTCVDSDGNTGRVWISLNSRKQIDQAAKAGIVEVDAASQDWTVKVGAQFQLVVAGGKNVAILPAPKAG